MYLKGLKCHVIKRSQMSKKKAVSGNHDEQFLHQKRANHKNVMNFELKLKN